MPCANQSVSHIILNEQYILNKFLFYYFQAKYWKIRSIYKGSNQPDLNVSLIKQFDIPIPLISEQKIIIQKIEEIFSLIDNNEKLILQLLKKIERIKISILNQVFEGKLVPQDPNDEPASELLERIKLEN